MDSALEIFETLKSFKRANRSRKSSQGKLLDYCIQVLGSIEHIHVDFKQKSHTTNPKPEDDDKKNLAKALSGFANSSGGVLIWGIEDKTLAPTPITDVPQFVSFMLQLASQITDPVVQGIDGDWIRSDRGSAHEGFGVIFIPESLLPPHRVILNIAKVKNQYYIRSGESFEIASHTQLEDMFGRRPRPKLEFVAKLTRRYDDSAVVVGIKNSGRGIAKFPYLEIVVPEPFAISEWGIDGNRHPGLPTMFQGRGSDRRQMFGGGSNFVVYPESEIEVIAIKVRAPYGQVSREADIPDLVISYSLCAESLGMEKGEHRISGKEFKSTLFPNG